MTAVRYDMNEGRNRPVRDRRVRDTPDRPRLAEHADPATCEHPITARCNPIINSYGYIARCADCGLHLRDHWDVGDDGAVRHRTTWEVAL